MKPLEIAQRLCLMGHIATMPFGWLGLLFILPNPEIIVNLPPIGQTLFRVSMSGGGVVNILLGAAAVALYAYRTLGLRRWLGFMVPAVCLSLSSELMGTSTGFPFGEYGYLNGLGYKVAGLVPFTIPLSWFYVGLVSYLIALGGLQVAQNWTALKQGAAIALGAILLTAWDFVLDPAMSQTIIHFWEWGQEGPFFGMPYQNFAGWLATGALFMSVGTWIWGRELPQVSRPQLGFPLVVYLSNFAYAAVLSGVSGFTTPVLLGILMAVIPALVLWWITPEEVQESEGLNASVADRQTVTPAAVNVVAK
ncbi:carotenoid biosynthesis protein [Roseofilum sp. BLCC_M154]|uniref:Carotenoid biosynthesis protein n=1 Tax=Roseofilum acuticapitatum BLCC-M154 TaxID=3022444 RepID=A0ABT7AN29_9CYAN|nr:carotenoid biosynthesis protein [Roseofilum acuticapitatum]MDJ1168298.1 carotenoid biosynthesis protein [Roseofilum acuticapitatum BLCC-M154]